MWNLVGAVLMLGGVAGVLYSWVDEQRNKQIRLELFLLFLQKSLYVMKREKIKVMDYFQRVIELDNPLQNRNELLQMTLTEILQRLSTNTYPSGQQVWEEVFRENEKNWNLDPEVFQIIMQTGNGFFGRSREENVSFLEKSIKELEEQQVKLKQKDEQERKVWVPVGMLGSMMVIILFL